MWPSWAGCRVIDGQSEAGFLQTSLMEAFLRWSSESRVTQPLFLSCCLFPCHLALHLVLYHPLTILWVSWKLLEPWGTLALSSGDLFSGLNLHVFGSINCQLPLKQVIVISLNFHGQLLFLNHRMRVVSSAGRNRCFLLFTAFQM